MSVGALINTYIVPDHSDILQHTKEHTVAIQLPPLSPSKPVRTQALLEDRPHGRCQAVAYGSRVEGPDPADTPKQLGGFYRVAPSWNLDRINVG